ncbi:MAG: hypothetical protein EU532_01240 [Promethearchaeota archaeon]|nr:MAG: hypothetical protein EU532_01240 [Candidatus Lokiarchaeota archaeon]
MRKVKIIILINLLIIPSLFLLFTTLNTTNLTSQNSNEDDNGNYYFENDLLKIADDSFEDNDVFSAAWEIQMSYYPSMWCEDNDWFKFKVNIGERFVVKINYDNYYGNLSLALYNYTGDLLDFDNETITWSSDYDNDYYYIKISYFTIFNNYDLDIYTIYDKYEPNNDILTAAKINKGFHRGLWCDDDDWYAFSANFGEIINISIFYELSSGDLDIKIYDKNGYLGNSDNWDKDYESYSFTASYPGDYFLLVYTKTALVENWYDMKILSQEITIFSDNFESGYLDTSKWSKNGVTNYWHVTTRDYYGTGFHSLWCGNESSDSYDKGFSYKDSVIISDLDLRDFYFAELSFDLNFTSGSGEYISISAKVVGDNLYNSPKYTDKILEIEGTSENTYGWEKHTVDLSFFCGFEHVDIIFNFEADIIDNYGEGIKIDNVLVKGCKDYNLIGNSLGINVGDEFYYYFPYINEYIWRDELFGRNIFPYSHETIKIEIFSIYDRGAYWDIIARFWDPWDDFDELRGTDEIKYMVYKNPLNMKSGADYFIPNNNIIQYLQCADNTDWFNNYNIEHWCNPYWNDYSIEYFYGDFRVNLYYTSNGILKGINIYKMYGTWDEKVLEMWLGEPIDDGDDDEEDEEEKRAVPGYDMVIIISLICFVSLITAAKMKKTRK